MLGRPLMTAFSFASVDERLNIFGLVDIMEEKGEWAGLFKLLLLLLHLQLLLLLLKLCV